MTKLDATPRPAAKFGRQGTLLFCGYATAQGLSFLRNAIIGHALSKGDFGIAAAIVVFLQLFETLTDLGADRLIVQAKDGNRPRMLAACHALLIVRGVLLCAIALLCGPALAAAFNVPQAAIAFQLAGMATLIKGFGHLDWRRAQRRFDNRPHLAIEIVPQAVALTAALPLLALNGGYAAVVWLSIVQAVAMVIVSHVVARTRYRIAIDANLMRRQLAFGWPILASALPLAAIYQGDRIIVAQQLGTEQMANFTAAFLVTMVPGLIAAKVGHALMLPMFARSMETTGSLRRPFLLMTESVALLASLYLSVFVVAGGAILPVAFGDSYAHLDDLVACLAAMWALRMVQAVPGMALMAAGETRPLFTAGLVRAAALPFIVCAASTGASLLAIAAVGCAFEAFSLFYIAWRAGSGQRTLTWDFLQRVSFLVPAAAASVLIVHDSLGGLLANVAEALVATVLIVACAVSVMPALRAQARMRLHAGALVTATRA